MKHMNSERIYVCCSYIFFYCLSYCDSFVFDFCHTFVLFFFFFWPIDKLDDYYYHHHHNDWIIFTLQFFFLPINSHDFMQIIHKHKHWRIPITIIGYITNQRKKYRIFDSFNSHSITFTSFVNLFACILYQTLLHCHIFFVNNIFTISNVFESKIQERTKKTIYR